MKSKQKKNKTQEKKNSVHRQGDLGIVKPFTQNRLNVLNSVWKFSRVETLTSITNNNLGTQTAGAYTFKLSDLPNYTELTSMFDRYQIDKVVLNFRSISKAVAVNTGGSAILGAVGCYVAVDVDDNGTPTLSEMQQKQGVCRFTTDDSFSLTLQPRWQSSIYISGVSTGYKPSTGFIDCAYPDVPHYAVKFYLEPSSISASSGCVGFTVDACYYISFKNQR